MNREEIFEKAHLNESSDMAREYFKQLGLEFKNIKLSDYYKLSEFIQDEINPLLADKSYQMIDKLRMKDKIKKDKWGFYLLTSGYYFNEREAISFYNPEANDYTINIGFCGWASGCNRIPYIKGFIKWCDWMCVKGKNEVSK